ncbi:MAG: RHS repeat protein [Gammaproteobacteria bacterium]|nr:RHS repeat protein [Gammaproteobacteria bacterium]
MQLTYDSGRDCGLGVGRLCTVRTDADVMRFRYDAFGQATRQTDTIDGVSYVTAYAYNTLNRLTRMTYPDGRTVTYRRDALDRIAGIDTTVNGRAATVLSGITYRLDGLLAVAVHLKLTRGIPGMAVSIPAFRQSGRHGPGMVAAMVPEWWPPWSRNGGRHGPGMVAAMVPEWWPPWSRNGGRLRPERANATTVVENILFRYDLGNCIRQLNFSLHRRLANSKLGALERAVGHHQYLPNSFRYSSHSSLTLLPWAVYQNPPLPEYLSPVV